MGGDIGDYHHDRQKAFATFMNEFPSKYHANLLLMLGNHDVRTGAKADKSLDPDLIELYHSYLKQCGIVYQEGTMCIDAWIEGYHFLLLNTVLGLKDKMELNEESMIFLREKLAEKAESGKPIFVMTHQAFNSTHWRAGLFGGFGVQDEELKEIFLAYPQIVMLNGHIHNGFGVIESIQRPFGTLIEIPSLTRGENGITKKGTGYLLKIHNDRLVFNAWNFYENIPLPEYDSTILLPTLSVLAKSISHVTDEETKKIFLEANVLMNKKYENDIPSGDSTTRSQEFYGIDKIYGKTTWDEINALRNKIIKINTESEIIYHTLEFKNATTITAKMINDAVKKYRYVEIVMSNGLWSKEIYMPSVVMTTQRVRIFTTAGYNSMVFVDGKEIRLVKGDEIIFVATGFWRS